MKAKIIFVIIIIAAVGAGAFFLGRSTGHNATGETPKEGKTLYTCGMDPQVIQDHPGNCPICSMKLTPIRKQVGGSQSMSATGGRKIKFYKSTMTPGEISQTPRKDSMGMDMVPVYEEEAAAAESSIISIDPVTTQNMGLRTGVVTRGPLRRVIRTVGAVDFNETALADVTTKFKGWVEKLYVDSTGKEVHKGEPLFEIYSPELFSAQTEFLLALDSTSTGGSSESLKASALNKLKFFDIPDDQIADVEKTRQAKKTMRIVAPIDGFVTEKMVVEGQMVEAGMKIYRLANLSIVWVQAQFYEQDLPFLELGQEALVKLTYLPDREFRGRVTYIYPTLDEKTRTVKVRLEFHNPGFFLKPGMFATVELRSELESSALLVPDMAVLRSGEKNTVFVALDAGKFDPRIVTLGPRAEGNMYQVVSGLNEGERVVTSGQFMLDSESQLREAIQKMLKPASPASAAFAEHPAPANTNAAAAPLKLYTCPMASHADVVSDKPGKCSKCEMVLVPTSTVAHGKTAEDNWRKQHPADSAAPAPALPPAADPVAAYICPMPEHVAIRYDQPGKCPLCGMTLIPVAEKTLAKVQPGGRVEYYTCPMTDNCPVPGHGNEKYEKAGKCPVCGMTLVPVMQTPRPATQPKTNNAAATAPLNLYTCPMASHADVVSDKPDDCPKCGMKLVGTSTVAHGKTAELNWGKQHSAPVPATAAPQHQH